MKRMNRIKRIAALALSILLIAALASCGRGEGSAGEKTDRTPASTETPEETALPAETREDDPSFAGTVADLEITTSDGEYTQNGNIYTLTKAGTYTLKGNLPDGQIRVEAGEDDEVELDLDGVSIVCSFDSPIYAAEADKVKIVALENTVNVLKDTRSPLAGGEDGTGSGALYALCDLTLSGTGSLNVTSSFNNGVHTKDDLKIKDLTLSVTAPNNAIKGNDSVSVGSGKVTAVSTEGDGIKTDNSDLSSKGVQRGTVAISGGEVTIYAACDGIDAAYDAVISGDPTSVSIYTHGYSSYTADGAKKTTSQNGFVKSADSAKGIKADNEVAVSGGTVDVHSMDDGIHANGDVALENGEKPKGNVTLSGGKICVVSADDGIHADGTLLIKGGYIDVSESHEGLEGHLITIEDGEIHVYATDDGVNATSSGGRASDGMITVSGGKIFVEVAGRDVDGIDSNGSFTQTGGFVLVCNPNADMSGNISALDTDGSVSVTGGVIVALGTVPGNNGMSPGGRPGGRFGFGGMTASSSLPSGYVTFNGSLDAGSHSFSFGPVSESFSLRSKVTGGWIWAEGITSSNYTLK